MGSSSSKIASNTAKSVSQATSASKNAAARKYPTRDSNRILESTQRSRTQNQSQNQNKQNSRSRTRNEDEAQQKEFSNPSITTTLAQSLPLTARLQKLGPALPTPTLSTSSTFSNPPLLRHSHQSPTSHSTTNSPPPSFTPSSSSPSQTIFPDANQNPAVSLLTARNRLAEEAEREFEGVGKKGSGGMRFLDVVVLRRVLVLRGKGMGDREIEEALGLREGVVGMLGGRGVFGAAD